MKDEKWKKIKNHEGHEISDHGNTRRGEHMNAKGELVPARLLRPRVRKDGYSQLTLSTAGKRDTVFVHRLVAEAFLPNLEDKNTVHHIDANRSNNKAVNLMWVTTQEHLRIGDRAKKSGLARRKAVNMFTLEGEFLCTWASASIAEAILGCDAGHISDCCLKRPGRKSCGGYVWRFADDEE